MNVIDLFILIMDDLFPQAVRDHVQSHACLRTLRCEVCQLSQPSRCALLWHTLTHLFPIYTCPQCASPFLESTLLERHLSLHKEEGASVKQDDSSPENSGEGQAELRCFLCPQTFRSETAFHYHLSVHSNELQGSQVWPVKRKVDQLLEYSSSSSSPLESSSSGKAGYNLSLGFSMQDKMAHGGTPFIAGLLLNGNSGGGREKLYRCRYCGKHFAHSGEFTYHLRIHTGEKPYQCKVCLRFFRGRSTMICHLKTHSGALMYRCTICGCFSLHSRWFPHIWRSIKTNCRPILTSRRPLCIMTTQKSPSPIWTPESRPL